MMRLLLEVFVLSLIVVVRTQTTIQTTATGIQATEIPSFSIPSFSIPTFSPIQLSIPTQTSVAAQTTAAQTTQTSLSAPPSTVSPGSPLQTYIANLTSAPLSTAISVGNALFQCCGNLLSDLVSCSDYVHYNLSYNPVSLWNQAATVISCFCAQNTYINTASTCQICCESAAPLTIAYYAILDTSICLNPIEALSLTTIALSGESADRYAFVPVPGPADTLNTNFRFYGNAATTTAFGNSPAETYNQQTSTQTSSSSSLSSSTIVIIVVVIAVALIAVVAAVIVLLCYRRNRNQKTNGSQAFPLPAYPIKPQQPVHVTPPPQRPVHATPPPQRPVHVTPPPQQPVHVTTLPTYADIMAQRKHNDRTTGAQITQQPQLAIDHQNPSSYDNVAAKPDDITAKPDDITAKPDDITAKPDDLH